MTTCQYYDKSTDYIEKKWSWGYKKEQYEVEDIDKTCNRDASCGSYCELHSPPAAKSRDEFKDALRQETGEVYSVNFPIDCIVQIDEDDLLFRYAFSPESCVVKMDNIDSSNYIVHNCSFYALKMTRNSDRVNSNSTDICGCKTHKLICEDSVEISGSVIENLTTIDEYSGHPINAEKVKLEIRDCYVGNMLFWTVEENKNTIEINNSSVKDIICISNVKSAKFRDVFSVKPIYLSSVDNIFIDNGSSDTINTHLSRVINMYEFDNIDLGTHAEFHIFPVRYREFDRENMLSKVYFEDYMSETRETFPFEKLGVKAKANMQDSVSEKVDNSINKMTLKCSPDNVAIFDIQFKNLNLSGEGLQKLVSSNTLIYETRSLCPEDIYLKDTATKVKHSTYKSLYSRISGDKFITIDAWKNIRFICKKLEADRMGKSNKLTNLLMKYMTKHLTSTKRFLSIVFGTFIIYFIFHLASNTLYRKVLIYIDLPHIPQLNVMSTVFSMHIAYISSLFVPIILGSVGTVILTIITLQVTRA